jgi:hypothetical protein
MTSTMPAPSWLREMAQGRASYEELLGWPVSLHVRTRSLVVAVGHVLDAVSMPATLGASVKNELGLRFSAAPIIADPDGTRWTLLTKPVRGMRPEIVSGLAAWQVDLAPLGSYVAIPVGIACSTPGACRWIQRPIPHYALPPARHVVETARRVMSHEYLALGA